MSRLRRFAVYGLGGLAGELVYTALAGRLVRGTGWRSADTSPLMFPVYGMIAVLYEPLRDALRGRPLPARATAYAAGFTACEYGYGRLLRSLGAEAPWDYSHARGNVHGLVRPSYLPLWAAVGMALEPVDERLRTGRATRAESTSTPR